MSQNEFHSDGHALRTSVVPDWIISDTHFCHANIRTHCRWRSSWSKSIDEHDHLLIGAWNSVVQSNDLVMHLGDFALASEDRIRLIRFALNGKIILVRGNHDRSSGAMRRCGMDWVGAHVIVQHGERTWSCRHNPMHFTASEARNHVGLLHGHCHGNGYGSDVLPAVSSMARDCSLDAVRSIAPVSWASLTENPKGF
jgi:calcineurin-like phosphoesterase family protein